jgi:cobalt transporter subunit CbtA
MIQRMVVSALLAGFAAGLVAALLHFAFVQPKILLAEQYESGALVHFEGAKTGVGAAHDQTAHDHAAPADAPADASAGTAAESTTAAQPAAHDHPATDEAEASPLKRNALTAAFYGLTYVSYGLLLVAAFAAVEQTGRQVTAAEGLLWGLAGFAVFQLAPAMGLEPELPGTPAADLAARQIWWWGTAASTAMGLAALAYGSGPLRWALGLVLLALPHVIGAPHMDGFGGVAPPELASTFAARTLGVSLVAWLSLGYLATRLWAEAER